MMDILAALTVASLGAEDPPLEGAERLQWRRSDFEQSIRHEREAALATLQTQSLSDHSVDQKTGQYWAKGACHAPMELYWVEHFAWYVQAHAGAAELNTTVLADEVNAAFDLAERELAVELAADRPEGAVYGPDLRFPDETQTLEAGLSARANLDQVIHAVLYRRFMNWDGDTADGLVDVMVTNGVLCRLLHENSDAIVEFTSVNGFPNRQVHGGRAENAATLLAKHAVREDAYSFLMLNAALSAGAGEMGQANFAFLADSWFSDIYDLQLVGSVIDCEEGVAILDPALFSPPASLRFTEAFGLTSVKQRLEHASQMSCAR